jgi:multiple sugar transport system ATP-binding protein
LWRALAAQSPENTHRLGLRPEHLHIAAAGNGIPAKVILAEHLGDSSILYLRVEGVSELLNAKVGIGHSQFSAGQTVGLVPDMNWVLSFDAKGKLLPIRST